MVDVAAKMDKLIDSWGENDKQQQQQNFKDEINNPEVLEATDPIIEENADDLPSLV